MSLPDNFSPAEHLQDLCKKVVNRQVKEYFSDLGETWQPEIGTSRGSLRVGCTHLEDDSIDMTLLRMFLFYFVAGEAQAVQAPIYGIPVSSYQESFVFKPQINLLFQEDYRDVEISYQPVRGEISFRLMHESQESLTMANARTYANKIRSLFASGNGFVWKRGKLRASYFDKSKGYMLQLLVRSESEAKRVIEQVLDIQSHSPDWQFLNVSTNQEPSRRYPT